MTTIEPVAQASYPAREGHHVEVWAGEIAFYEHLLRAMRAAKRSVWVAVSFIHRSFRFPGGERWWDVLDELAAKGVEVRVLFWRNPRFFSRANVIQGDAEDLAWLKARNTRWLVRWDSSGDDAQHCHHQKLWLIDAGGAEPTQKDAPMRSPEGDEGEGAVAYVGGMVKTRTDLVERVRERGGQEGRYDVTLALQGPAVADVAQNFIQRWNQAATDAASPSPWPDEVTAGPILAPPVTPKPTGAVRVQVLRTIKAGLYRPSSSARRPLKLWEQGETSIWRAYRAAFQAARRTIYLENQHPGEERLLKLLVEALHRGVKVLLIVPGEPMPAIVTEKNRADEARRRGPGQGTRYSEVFETLRDLSKTPDFTMAKLVKPAPWEPQGREEVYVHAKVCVVDGRWATIGSANFVDLSMEANHTELNVAYWGDEAQKTLERLISGHGGAQNKLAARHLTPDEAWVTHAQALARANATRLLAGEPLQGALVALNPARYGETPRAAALGQGERV